MIDRLIDKIIALKNPVCVGIDTRFEYLPEGFCEVQNENGLVFAAEQILRFNKAVIDAVADLVPCVKVQSAYYELYGPPGVKTFAQTIRYAKNKGLVVIADIKRNDIGATAEAYAAAYLGRANIAGQKLPVFDADFATINAYLGSDGVKPFLSAVKDYKKGLFVLVKTSNPSSGELQDLMISNSMPLYMNMAALTSKWGSEFIGNYGYSAVGAVVGATYPMQAEELRTFYPNMFMLIPGYGAQGAGAQDLIPFFSSGGLGGIVNNSRGILTAYKDKKYTGMDFAQAARAAVEYMKEDILNAFSKSGISY